jgi:NTP pyrophosphatase (non-canonical NTP hydrolase)
MSRGESFSEECTSLDNIMDQEYLAFSLKRLAEIQMGLWIEDRGDSFHKTTEEVRTISFALIGEILELGNELHWKSWKPTPDTVDKERIKEEFADVMAFFGSLAALVLDRLGIFPEELVEAYLAKVAINKQRFEERDQRIKVRIRIIQEEEQGL